MIRRASIRSAGRRARGRARSSQRVTSADRRRARAKARQLTQQLCQHHGLAVQAAVHSKGRGPLQPVQQAVQKVERGGYGKVQQKRRADADLCLEGVPSVVTGVGVVDKLLDRMDLDLLKLAREKQRRDAEQFNPGARAVADGGYVERRRVEADDVIEDSDGQMHRAVALAELEGGSQDPLHGELSVRQQRHTVVAVAVAAVAAVAATDAGRAAAGPTAAAVAAAVAAAATAAGGGGAACLPHLQVSWLGCRAAPAKRAITSGRHRATLRRLDGAPDVPDRDGAPVTIDDVIRFWLKVQQRQWPLLRTEPPPASGRQRFLPLPRCRRCCCRQLR